MPVIAADNPAPPSPRPSGNRRWTTAAAVLAGLAVLVLFGMTMLFIFQPDPNRKILDRIDALMAAGDWQEAEALCRREIAAHIPAREPASSSWTRPTDLSADLGLRLGISLSMRDRFDEARVVLDGALARSPSDARLALNRALLDYRTGNLDDALARLRKLAEDAPYAPNVNYHIGRIYEAKGLYDQALKAYRDELNISSSAGAWQRYLVLKKMKGATTTRPDSNPPAATQPTSDVSAR
jgi:tetratricopeptide (TPR) repeat protein